MDDLSVSSPVEKPKAIKRKILAPVFATILIIVLVLVKRQNPDFPLGYVILIGAAIVLVGAVVFFSFDIAQKFQKNNSKLKAGNTLPEPADTKLLWDRAKAAVTNNIYRDHISTYIDTENHSVGKNMKSLVVEFKVETVWRPGEKCSILINANYPNRMPSVLFNPNATKLRTAIQSMSFDPEDAPNEEETVVHNDITGTTSTTKRKTFNRKEPINTTNKKENVL